MIAWGGTPFGAAVGAVLAEATDIRITFFVMSIVLTVIAVISWFSPLRDKVRYPSPR